METPNPKTPVDITFREMSGSDHLRDECLTQVARLERQFSRLTSCRIVITETSALHRKGPGYDVHVHLSVPHVDVVVSRDAGQHPEETDAVQAIRRAFATVRRSLGDQVDQRRGS